MCDAPSSEPAPSQSELRDINATDIETPQFCTVDFCLIPIGTSSPSVSKEIADVQRFLKKTGVKYSMHSAGTSLEGSWDEVMATIGKVHTMVHRTGVIRVYTNVRIGTRIDKQESMEAKVASVNAKLSKD